MDTYTTTADSNGEFSVSFPKSYTSGQKITITADKGGISKSIEMHAPSEPIVPISESWFSCSGTLSDFPLNVGSIILKELTGAIAPYVFYCPGNLGGNIFEKATGLKMGGCTCTSVGSSSFEGWINATSLQLPSTLTTIGGTAFLSWIALESLVLPNSVNTVEDAAFQNLTSCKNLTLGSGLQSIGDWAFAGLSSAVSVTCLAVTPPVITSATFNSIKSTAKFYVPSASLAAYKAAPIWKTFASKIYAIP